MSNPTTPFSWQMPTATDLVTDLPADFEVFGQAVATSMADLLGGTSGQILAKNSNTDMDFVWVANDVGDITAVTAGTGISGGGTSGAVTITNSMATAITTAGDLIKGTGSGTFDRLGIGSSGQVLTVTAGAPAWATPASTNTVVGCSIYNSAVQTVANATASLVSFNSEYFDTNGFHDNATNNSRITIPTGKSGYYLITASLGYNFNATGFRETKILLNGSQLQATYNLVTSVGYTTQTFACVANLTAADYIQLTTYQSSGGSLDSSNTQNNLSAIFLGV
jgi:hypothetical protein